MSRARARWGAFEVLVAFTLGLGTVVVASHVAYPAFERGVRSLAADVEHWIFTGERDRDRTPPHLP